MYKPLKHHRILGEHRPKKSSIIGAWIVALLFIFLGLMIFYTMMTFDDYDLSARIYLGLLALAFIIGSMGYVINQVVSKLFITPEAVIRVSIFGKTILPMAEIDCYEDEKNRITLHATRLSKFIIISNDYDGFASIEAWAHSQFQNKDVIDEKQETEEMLSDLHYGASEEDIRNKANKLKKIIYPLNVVTTIVVLFIVFLPSFAHDFIVSIAALLPLVAVFLYNKSHGLAKFYVSKTDPHPSLLSIGSVCSLGLLYSAWRENLLHIPSQFWLIVIVVTLVLTYLCTRNEHITPTYGQRDLFLFIGVTLIGCFVYSYSTLIFCNITFDPSKPKYFDSSIKEKWFTTGKGHRYYVKLALWNGLKENEKTCVSYKLYNKVQIGEPVTIEQYEGCLGINYYYPIFK